nr:unnamed protein product [Callosobruchus chinensis]
MMIAFVTFLSCLLVVSASNCTTHCPLLPAATTAVQELKMIGDNYLYSHHRFGAPIVSKKCWSSSFFAKDYNVVDDVFNLKWTLYAQK